MGSDPRELANRSDESFAISQMMKKTAAHDHVEAPVSKRQMFGVASEKPLDFDRASFLEHRGRDIDADVATKTLQHLPQASGAARDVEYERRAPAWPGQALREERAQERTVAFPAAAVLPTLGFVTPACAARVPALTGIRRASEVLPPIPVGLAGLFRIARVHSEE